MGEPSPSAAPGSGLGRKLAGGSGRKEVVAMQAFEGRTGCQMFGVRDAYAQMAAAGTRFVESTVCTNRGVHRLFTRRRRSGIVGPFLNTIV